MDPKKAQEEREKILATLKEKHKRVVMLVAPAPDVSGETDLGGETIAVVPPSRAQWRRFRVVGQDEVKRVDALEMLLRDCLVYPEAAAFEALLEARPGLVETFGEQVLELAGAGVRIEKNA